MMNIRRIAILGSMIVLAAMALSGPVTAQPRPAQEIVGARVVTVAQRGIEPHPEMQRALRSLENARVRLERSAHDFHGHRAKALALTDRAIEEVHKALRSDRM
jgi:hypothetical protein